MWSLATKPPNLTVVVIGPLPIAILLFEVIIKGPQNAVRIACVLIRPACLSWWLLPKLIVATYRVVCFFSFAKFFVILL